MTTIGTSMREVITMIGMLEIIPPAIVGEERSIGETMKTGTGKVTETTNALTRNETLGKKIVESRQRSTNGIQTKP